MQQELSLSQYHWVVKEVEEMHLPCLKLKPEEQVRQTPSFQVRQLFMLHAPLMRVQEGSQVLHWRPDCWMHPSSQHLLPLSLKLGRQSEHTPLWYLTHPNSIFLHTPAEVRQNPHSQAMHLYSLQLLQFLIEQLLLFRQKGRQHSVQTLSISFLQPRIKLRTQKLLIKLWSGMQALQMVWAWSAQLRQFLMTVEQIPPLRMKPEAQLMHIPLLSFYRQPRMLDSWHLLLIRQSPVWQVKHTPLAALTWQQS